MSRWLAKTVRLMLVVLIAFLSISPISQAQDENWRTLTRQGETEHIILFVTGWQLFDSCLLSPRGITRPGFILDDCEKPFNPVWTWTQFKDHLQNPHILETLNSILHKHAISFPSYPENAQGYSGGPESRVIYYSYTGNYNYILDTEEDDDNTDPNKFDIQAGCTPAQQLDRPIQINGKQGYQCLPNYTKADTSILFHRVDNKTFWEALYDNLLATFSDPNNTNNLDKFAQLYLEAFRKSPLAPDLESVINEAQKEFASLITNQVIERTLKDFGVYQTADISPQRALFNLRAEHLQRLIDSIVQRFSGKNVEITIIAHSQGGLVSTYWAGWEGSGGVQKDVSHVNTIVTLDSPLSRQISLYGISNVFLKSLPNIPISVPLPSISLPFLGEIFPGGSINVEIPIGDYLRSELLLLPELGSQVNPKLFWGIDDIVERAPSQVPIYTIRNKLDIFVTADYAWLGTGKAWHDKQVEFGGNLLGANHGQVTIEESVSKDLHYVAVSGSIYAPNKASPHTFFVGGSRNQTVDIEMAAPAFLRTSDQSPSPTDFAVLAIPSGGGTQAAYVLDVVGVVNDSPYLPGASSKEVTAPPMRLTAVFRDAIPEGIYDLQVTYNEFANNNLPIPSIARAREALRVVGGELSDTSLVVVIDRSGSMGQALPDGTLKIDAVKNAASFLTQLAATTTQNRFGILTFEGTAQKQYPASGPLQEVTLGNLNNYLSAISSLFPLDGTRLTNALIEARAWFQEGATTHRTKAIIALTDGASSDQWQTNFTDIPVYTIGFGNATVDFNEEELKRIAADTGGTYFYAPTEAELRAIYESIQRQVSGANGIIQLEKSLLPDTPQTTEFVIDPTIKQLRLVANWDATNISGINLKLVTPQGVEITRDNFATLLPGSTIFETRGSWVFSISIPDPGTWRLIVTGAQIASSRGLIQITSASNTAVQLKAIAQAAPGQVGQPLQTFLVLTNLDPDWSVTSLLDVKATVVLPSGERVPIDLFDDGFHGDGAVDDLTFAAVVPARFVREAGSYVIEAVVKGILANRVSGKVFASVTNEDLPFERVFSAITKVESIPPNETIADLASMVVRKPGSSDQFCVTYLNRGPGTATDVGLFIQANNAIYSTSSVAATRTLGGFSFGWRLGQLSPGNTGTIETMVIPLDNNIPVKVASWINDGALSSGTEINSNSIDPTGADVGSIEGGSSTTYQLNTGWTLLGLKQQPTVNLPRSVLCALNGSVDVILGYKKMGLTYDPTVPDHINTLKELNSVHGYWIRVDSPSTLAVSGINIPVDTALELNSGWNLVNYLPDTVQTVTDALSFIDGHYTSVLGYDQGATSFYTSIPPRLNTLQTMEPGKAYWIYMKRARTLVYHKQPQVSVIATKAEQVNAPQRPSGVMPSNQWINFYSEQVTVNGQSAPVGALVEVFAPTGIKVGEARIVEPGLMQLLAVYADDPYTKEIDGARTRESLSFTINGQLALVTNGIVPTWTTHGDLIEINLAVGGFNPSDLDNHSFLPLIAR